MAGNAGCEGSCNFADYSKGCRELCSWRSKAKVIFLNACQKWVFLPTFGKHSRNFYYLCRNLNLDMLC